MGGSGGSRGTTRGGEGSAYRSFFEFGAEGMLLVTADGAVLDANREACRLLRRTRRDLAAAGRGRVFDPADLRLRTAWDELVREGRYAGELAMLRGDGTRFAAWVSLSLCGEVGVGVVFRDAAKHEEEAQKRRREAESFYRTLVEQMPAISYAQEVGEGFAASYVSPQVEATLGYHPQEFSRDPGLCRELLHPDDRERVSAEDSRTDETGEPFLMEYRLTARDGSVVWVRDHAVLARNGEGGPRFWLGVQLDVTERKRAEERLRETQARFRTLVEQIPAVTYVQQVHHGFATTYVSPQVEAVTGYSPEDFRTDPGLWKEILHPDDRDLVLAEEARTDETGEPFAMDYRNVARDGSVVWVRDEAVLVPGEGGEPRFWQGVMFDITGLKRAEEQLREGEERFRATFERAAVGIALVSPHGRFLRVNRMLCQILGHEREDLLGKALQDITHSDDLKGDLALARRVLGGEMDEYSTEKRYVRKDYSQVWASLKASLVRDATGEPGYFVCVVEDITPRKRAEALLGSLTPREAEVLRLLARGKTNGEIARVLCVSVATVKNHVSALRSKLGASDRTEAAARAVELGLVGAKAAPTKKSRLEVWDA